MSKSDLQLTDATGCVIAPLARQPLSPEAASELAIKLKALSDPVRLRLLSVVASHAGGEACVCDLSAGIDLTQPTISHHLKILRNAGLLDSERRGSWVYYRVVTDALQQLSLLLDIDTCPDEQRVNHPVPLPRRLLAEFTGTALLVTVVVGSGIAAQQLSPDDVGLQLLENSTATVFGLAVLILLFGPVSGAHFNPVVSAADWLLGRRAGTGISASHVASYTVAQTLGGILGAVLANIMFDRQVIEIATKNRITTGHLVGEIVATAGLIALIFALARTGRAALSAAAVGAYIGAAYWFTSSTSFANPAVTVGRMFSDTFAGIAPGSAPGFIAAQILGALIGLALVAALYPDAAATAERRRCSPPHREDPSRRSTEFDMTDSPVPLTTHHRADLSIDQRLALRTAATRLHDEFGEHFGVETIERFLHSSYDQFAGRATVPNFLPLLAERWARQRLTALARVEGKITDTKPTVLFLCTHNAGRSQMALGFFNHLAGDQGVAWSGGSEPGNEINPAAIAAMAEVGIDIAREFPKPWTDEIVQAADVVVTMGCGDACPVFPGKRYEEWVLPDPAGQSVDAVRPIRDDIEERVRRLLTDFGIAPAN